MLLKLFSFAYAKTALAFLVSSVTGLVTFQLIASAFGLQESVLKGGSATAYLYLGIVTLVVGAVPLSLIAVAIRRAFGMPVSPKIMAILGALSGALFRPFQVIADLAIMRSELLMNMDYLSSMAAGFCFVAVASALTASICCVIAHKLRVSRLVNLS